MSIATYPLHSITIMGAVLLMEREKGLPSVLRKILSPSEYQIIQRGSYKDIVENIEGKEWEKGGLLYSLWNRCFGSIWKGLAIFLKRKIRCIGD